MAPLAGGLRELEAYDSAVEHQGVEALTGLRRLALRRCCVAADAVRRMGLLRHLTIDLEGSDSAHCDGWRRVATVDGEAALRTSMGPHLEDVHVRVPR